MKLFAIRALLSFNYVMKHRIHNDTLEAVIDAYGAQLISLKKEGKEYMWNRNPQYWADSALLLFPFIGRNYEDTYLYQDKQYSMGIHGFASSKNFTLLKQEEDHLLFSLHEDEETLSVYPFHFELQVDYRLIDDSLQICFDVNNHSKDCMIYSLGYHPGFLLHQNLEQYRIFFPNAFQPEEIGIVTKCMLNGENRSVDLLDNCLYLNKEMFRNSARVYTGLSDTAILQENRDTLVTIQYKGFKNIVLWQTLDSDADFICIEGWEGLPGRYGIIEDISSDQNKRFLKPNNADRYEVLIQI